MAITLQRMSEHEISWPSSSPGFALSDGVAHVWAACLDVPENELRSFADVLASEERMRACRFRYDIHRNRFIAGRGLLRTILGRYLDVLPSNIQFAYGKNGKPYLSSNGQSLEFNLAHSEHIALIAVATGGEIGVDVERVRFLNDFDELVARFFSQRETQEFRQLGNEEQPNAFFNLWTRKEAWLKATGEGIVHSLKHVEVSFLPGVRARFLSLPTESGEPSRWKLRELSPARDFVGALATSAGVSRVECWSWGEKRL